MGDNRSGDVIAHTDHFYVIAGKGAFVPGYCLVIPKGHSTTMADASRAHPDEFAWLTQHMTDAIRTTYGTDVAVFEHGMCGCMDGNTHGHLHLMPIPHVSQQAWNDAIDTVVRHRGAGMKELYIGDTLVTHPDDIRTILEMAAKKPLPNSQLRLGATITHADFTAAPADAMLASLPTEEKPYVYLGRMGYGAQQHSEHALGSQFGREVVYRLWQANDMAFAHTHTDPMGWQWQDHEHAEQKYASRAELQATLRAEPFCDYGFTLMQHVQASHAPGRIGRAITD